MEQDRFASDISCSLSAVRAYWEIAVSVPVNQCFDYLSPWPHAQDKTEIGVRVRVPFGTRTRIGILIKKKTHTECPKNRLKIVLEVLDTQPIVDAELLNLCLRLHRYYHYPLGQMIMRILPHGIRQGRSCTDSECLTDPRSEQDAHSAHSEVCVLTAAQETACSMIHKVHGFQCFSLMGVTGSGKTEVYLRAMHTALTNGKSILFLVPEIGLIAQTVMRIHNRLQVPIAILHSSLSNSDRLKQWMSIMKQEVRVVVGTRSAVFAPIQNLGLIVVDEEQDASFKSQSGFRYSGRDVALFRAQQKQIPIVLGSATPSIETYYNTQRGRYIQLILPERPHSLPAPSVQYIDLGQESVTSGLSAALITEIRTVLRHKKQVLIFVNRRGYATVLVCGSCQYSVACTQCDAKLAYHLQPARLICHHCGYTVHVPRACPHCGKKTLHAIGTGTEKIENTLCDLFPDRKILRVDQDSTRKKNAWHNMLCQIHSGEIDILVGTQMLAKGHHFAHIGLVGIVDIDQALYSADFRAIETMAQCMVQVSGRAGRVCTSGVSLIQTHHPNHPYFSLLSQKTYGEFLDVLLQERQLGQLPPIWHQVIIQAQSPIPERASSFLSSIASIGIPQEVRVMGPIPALLEKKAGRFRHNLIFQSQRRRALHATIDAVLERAVSQRRAHQVTWHVDVDPIED